MLKPGDLVGPYEIRGFLGQGGMGQVYKAFDPRLERTVALKVIVVPTQLSENDSARISGEFSARLLREARAVASLNHPNVVAIFDVGESDGRLFFAMEYVVGSTLRALQKSDAPIARKVRWLVEIARALESAHKAGLVHRDVKPENVMVREDGVVKVLDFGIARRAQQGSPHTIDTVTGGTGIAGTPVYMAPEQIKGREVDARCDQFAWGVTAYELLAGDRPWSEAADVLQTVAKVLTDPAPPLRDKVKDVPGVVEETILRALAKEPDARFPSMTEVVDALEPFAIASAGDRIRVTPLGGTAAIETPHRKNSDDPSAFAATTRVPTSVSLPAPPPSKAEKKKGKKKQRPRAVRLAIPIGLLALLGVVTLAIVKRRGPTPILPPGLVGAERPRSMNPEAEAAFKNGMQQWRDGAAVKARASLQHAVELDKTFAAAWLELALQLPFAETQQAQAAFQNAFENRHLLTDRDADLLDASEPFVRPHPDVGEWETRMARAVFRFKRDPELQYYLGLARDRRGDDEGAKMAFQAALRLDDGFVPALASLSNALRNLGKHAESLATTEKCLDKSPFAATCIETRYQIFMTTGECHRARDEADRLRQAETSSPRPFGMLARALLADGAARPAVEEALAHRWSLLPETTRAGASAWDKMYLSVVDGDLEHAEQLARDYDKALPQNADQYDHSLPARFRANMLLELGRPKEAGAVATEYLDKREAWPVYPFAPDPSLDLSEVLYRAGSITKAELDERRQQWLAAEKTRLSDTEAAHANMAWMTWTFAWGSLVETKDEAVEALAHRPSDPIPGGSRRSIALDFNLGKSLALAGKGAEALPLLQRVTGTCTRFDDAILVLRARDYLGQAYEATGDAALAKAAYEKVVATWPKTPSSRTVKHAQSRLR
jgi:serine/threonine-protein kinase